MSVWDRLKKKVKYPDPFLDIAPIRSVSRDELALQNKYDEMLANIDLSTTTKLGENMYLMAVPPNPELDQVRQRHQEEMALRHPGIRPFRRSENPCNELLEGWSEEEFLQGNNPRTYDEMEDDYALYVVIDRLEETDLAWRLDIEGTPLWLPKSRCVYMAHDQEVAIPDWIAVYRGLEP